MSKHDKLNIPKIVHISYDVDDNIPEVWTYIFSAWKRTNPTLQIMFHNNADNDRIVSEYFKWFLPTYNNFKYKIQKLHAARPMYLYLFGGVYIDINYEPQQSIASLFINEIADVYILQNNNIWYNSLMASVVNNSFWIYYLKHMQSPLPFYYKINEHLEIKHSTGYGKLTDIINVLHNMQNTLITNEKYKIHIEALPYSQLFSDNDDNQQNQKGNKQKGNEKDINTDTDNYKVVKPYFIELKIHSQSNQNQNQYQYQYQYQCIEGSSGTLINGGMNIYNYLPSKRVYIGCVVCVIFIILLIICYCVYKYFVSERKYILPDADISGNIEFNKGLDVEYNSVSPIVSVAQASAILPKSSFIGQMEIIDIDSLYL
jgi:hypothetical protein